MDKGQTGNFLGRILIVEDELDLAEPLLQGFREKGYQVSRASSGKEALQILPETWDVILLDLMLPDISGESLLDFIKQDPYYPAVLVLSAKTRLQDKLAMFRKGCDDYLTKPYVFEEVHERVRALLRRSPRVTPKDLTYGKLSLDTTEHRLSFRGKSIVLTPKESHLMRVMMERREEVILKRELFVSVWGKMSDPDVNSIAVHLFNLRKKLALLHCEEWLVTVRKVGFMLKKPGKSIEH